MQKSLGITIALGVVWLAACSPSPEQFTATALAAVAPTQASSPTASLNPTATASSTATATATFTPTLTSTPTLPPTPTATPTPLGGGSGRLIFACSSADGRGIDWNCGNDLKLKGSLNVFIANWDGSGLTPITDGLNGWNYLEDVSPDGHNALISSFASPGGCLSTCASHGDLYLVDLEHPTAEPQKLTNYLIKRSWTAAAWIDNTRLVYVGLYGGELGLFLINTDGTGLRRISQAGIPLDILTPITNNRIYWEGFTAPGIFLPDGLWWTSIDGSQQERLPKTLGPGIYNYELSTDKTTVLAFDFQTNYDLDTLSVASMNDFEGTRHIVGSLPAIHGIFTGYNHFWSPDGQIVLFLPERTHISKNGKPPFQRIPGYVLSIKDSTLVELPVDLLDQALGLNEGDWGGAESWDNAWSPDSRQILLEYRIAKADHSGGRKYILFNRETQAVSNALTNRAIGWGVEEPILWLPTLK